MMKWSLSVAAAGLLRALLNRVGFDRDRILLSSFRPVDWHSLTFDEERHRISLRVPAPNAEVIVHMLLDGLNDAEISIPGHALTDINVERRTTGCDSSVTLGIEALTIFD